MNESVDSIQPPRAELLARCVGHWAHTRAHHTFIHLHSNEATRIAHRHTYAVPYQVAPRSNTMRRNKYIFISLDKHQRQPYEFFVRFFEMRLTSWWLVSAGVSRGCVFIIYFRFLPANPEPTLVSQTVNARVVRGIERLATTACVCVCVDERELWFSFRCYLTFCTNVSSSVR